MNKPANFFLTDGDPLDIPTNVERIFIQGREIELSDRQTRLGDKYEQKHFPPKSGKNPRGRGALMFFSAAPIVR